MSSKRARDSPMKRKAKGERLNRESHRILRHHRTYLPQGSRRYALETLRALANRSRYSPTIQRVVERNEQRVVTIHEVASNANRSAFTGSENSERCVRLFPKIDRKG